MMAIMPNKPYLIAACLFKEKVNLYLVNTLTGVEVKDYELPFSALDSIQIIDNYVITYLLND